MNDLQHRQHRLTRLNHLFRQTLLVAALPAALVACGGGDATPAPGPVPAPAPVPTPPPPPPADTVAPTATVSGTSNTAATGAITLSYTFSEDVGTSFTVADIAVTNGTASAFTKVDATHYTVVLTPPANATGTMTATVAAAAFSDLASNASTVAVTATQTYNTVVAAPTYAALDFNTAGLTYKTTDFGGTASALTSTGVPAGGPAGQVVQITKTAGAQTWAGSTLSVGYLDSIGTLPFSATATKLTAMVYAPAVGADFKIKVEDANDGTKSVETDVLSTSVGWQTLTFDMATPASGTAALNLATTYNKLSVFPNFGVNGDGSVYYVGPIKFLGATAASAPPLTAPVVSGSFSSLSFDVAGKTYNHSDFGGNVSTLDAGPSGSNGQVLKTVKTAGSQVWAGTTVGDSGSATTPTISPVPFSATRTSFTARVWTPAAGVVIKLKVEDAADGTHSVEANATSTAAGWQTLTFNMATPATGTAALNLAWTYSKLSVFADFGNAPGADETFYFDDITFLP